MNIKKIQLWLLSGALFCTLLTHANAQEAYSSVGPNYGKLYNSTGSSSTPNYGATTNPSDRVAAQQSGLGYSQPATTVNQSTASANVPGYTNTPPSNLTSGFGGASLFPQGKSNITRCAATGSGSTNSDPECNAVNFLANNPSQKITLSSSDPMLKTGADIIGNASMVSPTNSRTCSTQNQAVAGTYSTETCNDYLTTSSPTCSNALLITFNSAPGCSVPGAYLGMTSTNICSWCIDPYVISEVYCATNGYSITSYTSPSGSRGDVYQMLFSNVPVVGQAGVSQGNTFIADAGQGCSFPLYYAQQCNSTTCSMQTSLIGSTCNGANFTAYGSYDIPVTWTMNEAWQDDCQAMKAALK